MSDEEIKAKIIQRFSKYLGNVDIEVKYDYEYFMTVDYKGIVHYNTRIDLEYLDNDNYVKIMSKDIAAALGFLMFYRDGARL